MLHFLNCLALTFAPLLIAYKATKLSEENGLRAVVSGAIGYAVTQVVKMFLMASVLPSSDDAHLTGATKQFHLIEELFKTLMTLLEIIGVQQTLSSTPSLAKFAPSTRILAIGLGMAAAESVLKYLIPIFNGARGNEFSWQYLEMSLSSNIGFILTLVFVCMVWLRQRTDLSTANLPVVWAILVVLCARNSVDSYLSTVLHLDSWTILSFHLVLAIVLGALSKLMLSAYTSQRATSSTVSKKQ